MNHQAELIMDHSKPLVSVVIPVYNGERYLVDAIQSVLDQTYRNFEVIVVDDGSTDGSAAAAKRFGEAIRYVHQANGGVCKARNAGLAAAQGVYLAFLDQDDLWLPDKLAIQVAYLNDHADIGAVYCQCRVSEDGVQDAGLYYSRLVGDDLIGIIRGPGPTLLMSTTMFRTDVIRKIGGFDEGIIGAGGEDIDLTVRLIEVTRVAFIPEILATYRIHSMNSSKNDMVLIKNRGIYLRKCFERHGSNPQIARYLERQWIGYLSDFGNLQIQSGCLVEGRQSLQQAICFSLGRRANPKMFMRSIGRLVRSYFLKSKR